MLGTLIHRVIILVNEYDENYFQQSQANDNFIEFAHIYVTNCLCVFSSAES